LTDESFCLGVEEADGEEDEVIGTSYVREEATYTKEDEHLPEGESLAPVEPRSGEAHKEGYDDR